ncbi:MAG: hypothetical protein ABH829_04615 [archaeon]
MTLLLGSLHGIDDFFLTCIASIAVLFVVKMLPHTKYREKGRQIVHLSYGILIVYSIMLWGMLEALAIASAVMLVFATVSQLVGRGVKVPFASHSLRHFERADVRPFKGAIFYSIGVFLTIFLFGVLPPLLGLAPHESAVMAAVLVLAFGDSFSTAFGMAFGTMKIAENRTAEGSFAGLIAAFMICKTVIAPNMALIAAVIGMLMDWLNLPIDDNFTIPIAVAVALL